MNPHSIPIWHVMQQEYIYFNSSSRSVKVANIRQNPNVSVAAYLDTPTDGLIVEGIARLRPDLRENISQLFEEKYDWNIKDDGEYEALIEVEPSRLIA